MGNHYKGPYLYNKQTLTDWNSSAIGIYYCGIPIRDGSGVVPYYIGRSVADGGIRGRLLQHLTDDYWPDVTHFNFTVCGSATEAIALEANEIRRFSPKYNEQLKTL